MPSRAATLPAMDTAALNSRETPLRDRVAIGILVATIAVMFADVLLFGWSLGAGDLPHYHFPMKKVVRELILSGHFPLWNRLAEAGQPMAANPAYEVFYPPQWLILLPSFVYGFKLHVVVHYFIAALGMYALSRSLKLGTVASVIAAFSFGSGGPLVSMAGFLPFLFSMTWLPLLLLFGLRFHRSGRTADFALAASCLAMQLLIGEPTVVFQSLLLLFIGALLLRRFFSACAITAAAGGLAAIQVIPMLDHVRDSVRSIPLDYQAVSKWSTAVARPLELLVASSVFDGRRFVGPERPFIISVYLGLPIALFALGGLVARIPHWRTALLICSGLYAVAIGSHTPLLAALYRSGIHSIRYPEKFLFGACFVVILFGAFALDLALAGNSRIVRTAMIVAVLLLVAGSIASAVTSPSFIAVTWNLSSLTDAMRHVHEDRVEWAATALRAVVLLALLAARRRPRAELLLILFTIADLAMITARLPLRVPDAYYAEPPALAAHLPPPSERVYHELGMERALEIRRMRGPEYETRWLVRNEMLPNLPQAWGGATVMGYDFDETTLVASRRFRVASDIARTQGEPTWPRAFMAMSNAPYKIVIADTRAAVEAARGDITRLTTARVIRDLPAAPRYFFASETLPCLDIPDCVARLRTAPPRVALVPPNVPRAVLAAGTVDRVMEGPSSADLDVTTNDTSFLAVSVTFHKYWRASIDGRSVPLIPTNLAYQGLFVPKGTHHVALRYRNPLLPAGAAASAVTILALAAMMFVRRGASPLSGG